jgi:hypothetical protein
MKPDPRFQGLQKTFWAYVRSISEWVGYTDRGTQKIKVPSSQELRECLVALGLAPDLVVSQDGRLSELGRCLQLYFEQRALILDTEVEPALMHAKEADALFKRLRKTLKSALPVAMNKQKGDKKKPAYLTGMVGMLIESARGEWPCDYDPRVLTAFTKQGVPVRTLSRRIDGAFPAVINPVAIWEIKEYYHTTTFGSRVADGVYETQLDGMELEEMRVNEGVLVKHYLFLDAHYTWWQCGRSYLCRIYDMVNMGLVDEVVVGRQIESRLPQLVNEWISIAKDRVGKKDSSTSIDA